jgi:hypothetical protein
LETACECTSNQFSFGPIGMDMRDRRIELKKELLFPPSVYVSIGGEGEEFKLPAELKQEILENWYNSFRYQG